MKKKSAAQKNANTAGLPLYGEDIKPEIIAEYERKFGYGKTKPNKDEKLNRENAVYDWLIKGMEPFRICHYASQMFGVVPRTAQRYIKLAREVIQKDSVTDRKSARSLAISRYTRLFNLSLVSGDLKSARQCQAQIDKLGFLYDMTDKELADQLDDGAEPARRDLSKLTDEELEMWYRLSQKSMIVEPK